MFAEHPGYFVHSWNVTNEEGMEALYVSSLYCLSAAQVVATPAK